MELALWTHAMAAQLDPALLDIMYSVPQQEQSADSDPSRDGASAAGGVTPEGGRNSAKKRRPVTTEQEKESSATKRSRSKASANGR